MLVFIDIVMVNAYPSPPRHARLANVLSDLEEILHADFKGLEEKIEAALTKIRIADAKANRE